MEYVAQNDLSERELSTLDLRYSVDRTHKSIESRLGMRPGTSRDVTPLSIRRPCGPQGSAHSIYTVKTSVGESVSDGALILARLANLPVPWGAQRFSVHLFKATFAYHDRDFPSAIRETEQADSFSEDPDLQAQSSALRAEALSESGAARAAVELLTPFLSRSDLSDAMRSHIDQAYAWAVLLCDEPGLFDDALARIERCVRRMPWVDVYIIKRACLLVAGAAADPQRIPEARSLVDSLKAFSLHGESLAYAALARGLVAAAEGRVAEARIEHTVAKKSGVTPASLRLLDRRLAAG